MGKQIKLGRGEVVEIDNNLKIKFLYNSHKRTMVGGPPSPLITYFEFHIGDRVENFEYHFETSYKKIKKRAEDWSWKGYNFKLIDYSYNDYLVITLESLQSPNK